MGKGSWGIDWSVVFHRWSETAGLGACLVGACSGRRGWKLERWNSKLEAWAGDKCQHHESSSLGQRGAVSVGLIAWKHSQTCLLFYRLGTSETTEAFSFQFQKKNSGSKLKPQIHRPLHQAIRSGFFHQTRTTKLRRRRGKSAIRIQTPGLEYLTSPSPRPRSLPELLSTLLFNIRDTSSKACSPSMGNSTNSSRTTGL